jgi:hypothetical protein
VIPVPFGTPDGPDLSNLQNELIFWRHVQLAHAMPEVQAERRARREHAGAP